VSLIVFFFSYLNFPRKSLNFVCHVGTLSCVERTLTQMTG
jgi:hypothetical protein